MNFYRVIFLNKAVPIIVGACMTASSPLQPLLELKTKPSKAPTARSIPIHIPVKNSRIPLSVFIFYHWYQSIPIAFPSFH